LKKRRTWVLLFICISFICCEVSLSATFERFIGVLRHEKIQRDQLAKLDFILARSDENKLEMSAILTLHFGDFESREYISYHFHKVHHFLIDQTFTFAQLLNLQYCVDIRIGSLKDKLAHLKRVWKTSWLKSVVQALRAAEIPKTQARRRRQS